VFFTVQLVFRKATDDFVAKIARDKDFFFIFRQKRLRGTLVIPFEHLNQHVSTLGAGDLNKLIVFFFFMDDGGAFFMNSGELTVQLA
jgi:hypothetical protein